jgi:aspartyl-tRNA(Asn)/glutamyl-tRNA(Gln) amidotransferase subunit C
MSVDKATVARIAHLARIGVNEAEMEALVDELNNILSWVEQLEEVDTDNVAPMDSVHEGALRWRTDEVTDGNLQAEVTANAPEEFEGFYVVPKVVE